MDPYEILGIETNASREEINEKYKMLLNQYTASQDETTESKIRELNAAYNMLNNVNVYTEVRKLMEFKNFPAAEAKLNMVNDKNDPEWNYLEGFIAVKKGWFETGLNYLRKAVELDPTNTEYLSSLNTLQARIIEYATRYASSKPNINQRPPNGNNNNMNACGGGGGNNGGMC